MVRVFVCQTIFLQNGGNVQHLFQRIKYQQEVLQNPFLNQAVQVHVRVPRDTEVSAASKPTGVR
jgi:hypothetical protein